MTLIINTTLPKEFGWNFLNSAVRGNLAGQESNSKMWLNWVSLFAMMGEYADLKISESADINLAKVKETNVVDFKLVPMTKNTMIYNVEKKEFTYTRVYISKDIGPVVATAEFIFTKNLLSEDVKMQLDIIKNASSRPTYVLQSTPPIATDPKDPWKLPTISAKPVVAEAKPDVADIKPEDKLVAKTVRIRANGKRYTVPAALNGELRYRSKEAFLTLDEVTPIFIERRKDNSVWIYQDDKSWTNVTDGWGKTNLEEIFNKI